MNEKENKKFLLEDENGITKEATVITALSIEDRKYLVYSVAQDETNSLVCASKVIKENDTERLVDIEEGEDKEKIKKFIDALSK